jgi:adenosyl cobinamide kinase/adenosyl cobinamide phosphate guanylyltransferase
VITFVLGGARSGKSEVAERLAGADVTFLATWRFDPADTEMAARVATHRARRPSSWVTVEPGDDLPEAVRNAEGTALVDSLTTWVAGARDFSVDAPGLCLALRSRGGDSIVVSDEVGLGVHPSHELGRRFRDALGAVNQAVAGVSDDVVLVVAGRCLRLEALA